MVVKNTAVVQQLIAGKNDTHPFFFDCQGLGTVVTGL